MDDGGRGWGRREGTTTLRVTYDVTSRSISATEMPGGVETPLAITHARQGLVGAVGAVGEGTDVLLLTPQ